MSNWREQEWRPARRGESVIDRNGQEGFVVKTEGFYTERLLWVEDYKGEEIYSGENAKNFEILDLQKTSDFQLKRYNHKGFVLGNVCSYKGDENIPLEIVQMDWNYLRSKMTICLRDRRTFEDTVMRTENDQFLKPFSADSVLPPEAVFSSHESGLKWRILISLAEKENSNWSPAGSPWEFFNKEDALKEIDYFKSRLLARRVSSVFSFGWDFSFPCWQITGKREEEKILLKVSKVESCTGSAAYFKDAVTAAYAIRYLSPTDWLNCLGATFDKF